MTEVALATATDRELRELLRGISADEAELSKRRRVVHAKIEDVRAALVGRLHEDDGDGVDASAEPWRAIARRLSVALSDDPLPELGPLPRAALAFLLRMLSEEEQELSERRRDLHERIDAMNDELLDRLKHRLAEV